MTNEENKIKLKSDINYKDFLLNKINAIKQPIEEFNFEITNKHEVIKSEFEIRIKNLQKFLKDFIKEIECFESNISNLNPKSNKDETLKNMENIINNLNNLKNTIRYEDNYIKRMNTLYEKLDEIDILLNNISGPNNSLFFLPEENSIINISENFNLDFNKTQSFLREGKSNIIEGFNTFIEDNINENEESEFNYKCSKCLCLESICFCEDCNSLFCKKCLNNKNNRKHKIIYFNNFYSEHEKMLNLFFNSINGFIKRLLIKSNYLINKEKIELIESNNIIDNNKNEIKYLKRVFDYPIISDDKNYLKSQFKFLEKIDELINNEFNINDINYDNFQISKLNKRLVQSIKNIFVDNEINIIKEAIKKTDEDYYSISDNSLEELDIIEENIEKTKEINTLEKYIEELIKSSEIAKNNKIIIENINLLTYSYMCKAFELKNEISLNIYVAFLKGFLKSSNYSFYVKKRITEELMNNSSNSFCFNSNFHIILIKNNILDINEYQNYISKYVEISKLQKKCFKLLNELEKNGIYNSSDKKNICSFYYDEKTEKTYKTYQIFFNETSNFPSDLNLTTKEIINFQICNLKDSNEYNLFSNYCGIAFSRIIKYYNKQKNVDKLRQKLKDFINSNFIRDSKQLISYIMVITQKCVNKSSLNDALYYPEYEAKSIYILLKILPNDIDKLKIFEDILIGIFKTFHYDYMKSIFNFNQRPYYKLLFNLIVLLGNFQKEKNSKYIKIDYMNLILEFLKIVSPLNYPGFFLAWLDLISCDKFISCFLDEIYSPINNNSINILDNYCHLILNLFVFLRSSRNFNNISINKIIMDNLYKFICLLSYSYPEFIISYSSCLIISLGPENNFRQLKNIILSTTPENICNLKNLDYVNKNLEEEVNDKNIPNIQYGNLFNIRKVLKNKYLYLLDEYLKYNDNLAIKNICCILNDNNRKKEYLFLNIYAIVIYWEEKINIDNNNIKKAYTFFLQMIQKLINKNRNYLINALLNELKCISKQTLYFILILFYILNNINNSEIEENIITLLFERLLNKPIPWGIELMSKKLLFKNDGYKLFNQTFVTKLINGFNFFENIKKFIEDKTAENFFEFNEKNNQNDINIKV